MSGYLNREELHQLLQNPWFTQFYSVHINTYAYYRGKTNATVLTLRYNVNSRQFSQEAMIESVIRTTLQTFSSGQRVIGLIEYDLVLMQPDQSSFYLWRANSNVSRNLPNAEQNITLTYDNIYLFIQNAANVNPSDLNTFFISSNIIIRDIVAVIITFISY